jgi:hypothetical protein
MNKSTSFSWLVSVCIPNVGDAVWKGLAAEEKSDGEDAVASM